MAPEDGYRSPAVQSAADSFDLHRDDFGQKSEPDYYARSRPRNNSNTNSRGTYHQQAPPVDDAVNHAFERSDAASQVDPGLVAQITEQVINTLKASGITGVQQSQPQPPPPINVRSGHSTSPTDSTAASLPRRYTPPSPTRHETASYRSSSPEPQLSEPASYSSASDMPRAKRSSSNASPVRASDDTRPRPRQVRIPSAVEETSTLEKIWQPLFQSGQPTPRLSQFLRGLALHIIDDYEPRRSLVISPAKMVQFFEDVKLSNEIYPWRDIFGGRITNESISRIYRDLRCQHHFIQLGTHCVPDIPALTPDGFDCLMTTLIQAHPSMEFDRLAKAVLDMPISNADDLKERFPKELSRRLFPSEDDIHQQQRLHAAISTDRNIQLRSSNPMPPPPPPQTQAPSSSAQATSYTERERAPYSSFSSAVDDEDLRSAPVQIERERQPYTAREGSGKIFDDDRKNPIRADPMTRPSRANSAAPAQPFAQSRPTDIPSTGQRHHRLSASGGQRPSFLGTPPTSHNPYTRSEGTNLGDIPSGYYASNLPPEDDRSRYARKDEDNRRASWFPSRGYEYPTSGYDDRRRNGGGTDGYGSYNGYPPTSRY